MTGQKCPYCGDKTSWVDSEIIYGRSYGMVYYCGKCDAWVGTHGNNTRQALGRLANSQLRELKKQAHHYFDALWCHKMHRDRVTKNDARVGGYTWLAKILGIPMTMTHIGMFDEQQCQKVIDACKPYTDKLGVKVYDKPMFTKLTI